MVHFFFSRVACDVPGGRLRRENQVLFYVIAASAALLAGGLFGLIRGEAFGKPAVIVYVLVSGPALLTLQYGAYTLLFGEKLDLYLQTALCTAILAALLVSANILVNRTVRPKAGASAPEVLFASLCAPFCAEARLFIYFVFRLIVGLQHGIGRI